MAIIFIKLAAHPAYPNIIYIISSEKALLCNDFMMHHAINIFVA